MCCSSTPKASWAPLQLIRSARESDPRRVTHATHSRLAIKIVGRWVSFRRYALALGPFRGPVVQSDLVDLVGLPNTVSTNLIYIDRL